MLMCGIYLINKVAIGEKAIWDAKFMHLEVNANKIITHSIKQLGRREKLLIDGQVCSTNTVKLLRSGLIFT